MNTLAQTPSISGRTKTAIIVWICCVGMSNTLSPMAYRCGGRFGMGEAPWGLARSAGAGRDRLGFGVAWPGQGVNGRGRWLGQMFWGGRPRVAPGRVAPAGGDVGPCIVALWATSLPLHPAPCALRALRLPGPLVAPC